MSQSSFLPEGTRNGGGGGGLWEIEEDLSAEGAAAAAALNSIHSRRGRSESGEDVYVTVGKEASSADALSWALKNAAARPVGVVYLIHVFPEIRYIPTSLGMMPKSQASRRQLESYTNQERKKRREMLQKFLDMCHAAKVHVDTLLIESDSIAKTIIDLISVLQIKRLIIGTSKPPKGYDIRSGGRSKAEQVYWGAPHYCEVAVIYEGRKLIFAERVLESSPLTPNPENRGKMKKRPMAMVKKKKNTDKLLCYWFCNKVS